MKIGLVLANVPGYSETFFRNKIKFLNEEGFEVVLFVDKKTVAFDLCDTKVGFTGGNGTTKGVFQFLKAVSRLLLNPVFAYRLFNANKKDDFTPRQNIISLLSAAHILGSKLDWLHFGFATMALNRENVAGTIGSKMAVSIRGYDIAIYPLKHPGCYNLLWKRLDKLHYISDDLLNLAEKNGFVNTLTNAMKITPAIDSSLFQPMEKEENKELRITTVARLHWKKGLEYTLEALSFLKKEGVAFSYSLIGEGQDHERLNYAAYQFDIKDEVKFAGKLSQKEVKNLLGQTDIYLQYSIQEGFCNSVLEAQAMGCICVVSDAEGLSENVLHEQTGFVVPKMNPPLLTKQLRNLLRFDSHQKEQLSRAAIERVKKYFGLERQKNAFVEFYRY